MKTERVEMTYRWWRRRVQTERTWVTAPYRQADLRIPGREGTASIRLVAADRLTAILPRPEGGEPEYKVCERHEINTLPVFVTGKKGRTLVAFRYSADSDGGKKRKVTAK